jgi:hypothetical protein
MTLNGQSNALWLFLEMLLKITVRGLFSVTAKNQGLVNL